MKKKYSFGQKLKQTRIDFDLSLRDLGSKCGISFATLCKIENDLQKPQAKTIKKITDALELPSTYFIDYI